MANAADTHGSTSITICQTLLGAECTFSLIFKAILLEGIIILTIQGRQQRPREEEEAGRRAKAGGTPENFPAPIVSTIQLLNCIIKTGNPLIQTQ